MEVVEDLLEKTPKDKLSVIKILKALVLIRMTEDAEARFIINQVMMAVEGGKLTAENPVSPILLRCYMELNERKLSYMLHHRSQY